MAQSPHNLRNSSTLFYFLNEYSSQVIYILLPKVEWKDWSLGPVLSEKHFPSRKKLLETVEKASAVTFSCYYYIKEKKKREPIRTTPAFPPVLCFSPLCPLSQGAPLPHQQSEQAAFEGFRSPWATPPGLVTPLIGLTACHSNLAPTPPNHSVVRLCLGAFNVANNESFFCFFFF